EFEVVRAPSKAALTATGAGDAPRALRFADLAVRHRFVAPRRYDVLAIGPGGKRLGFLVTDAAEIPIEPWLRALGDPKPTDGGGRLVRLSIRSSLPRTRVWSPRVDVTLYLQPSGEARIAAIERDE